ncbi:hypothetical protein BOX15_Mlig018253g5, partial [Macrostomum lignano]
YNQPISKLMALHRLSSACNRMFLSASVVQTASGLRSLSSAGGLADKFTKAQSALQRLTEDPGNAAKLKIYSLYKQATEGKCTKPKPGFTDFVGRAKWDAWSGLGDMTKDQAMQQYIDLVESMGGKLDAPDTTADTTNPADSNTASADYKEALVSISPSGVLWFTLNRPAKKNAISTDLYAEWSKAMEQAAADDKVKAMVITGAGEYFSSGNDLSSFTNLKPGVTMEQMAADGNAILRRFVAAFIDFPKPLIALVNGPAVGISVSTLGLYDQVFASDSATFHMPFSSLGQTPEGCSSYTLPRIMGLSAAASLVMFNRKISAQEALSCGLVSRVFPAASFAAEAGAAVEEIAALPRQTLIYAKQLLREPIRAELHATNERECNRLQERWISEDCFNAVAKFFSRKSKL